jgi:multiple sugar transport system substrate-binding protein
VVYGPFPATRNPQTAQVPYRAVTPDVGDVLVGIFTGQVQDWQQALQDLETRKQAAFEDAIQETRDAGADVSLDDYIFPDWNPMENYVTQPEK